MIFRPHIGLTQASLQAVHVRSALVSGVIAPLSIPMTDSFGAAVLSDS